MSASDINPQARRRVLYLCGAGLDTRSLRIAVLEEIRRAITFDAYAWLLTDPTTSVGTSPMADVPWLSELPLQIRRKYQTPVNRWTRLEHNSVGLLYEATGDNPAASLVWRDLLTRYGIGDVASVVFRDRLGCWGFLELWRSQDRGRFRPEEAAFLADIVRPLAATLHRAQVSTFVAESARDEPVPGPVVLLLSPDLEVRAQTPKSLAYLRVLVPPAEGRAPIPVQRLQRRCAAVGHRGRR